MKKIYIILIFLLLLGGVLVVLRGSEDDWICQNGKWVKHGNPSASMPTTPCKGANDYSNEILVDSPGANDEISSPLIIKGRARGNWYFEASFPIKLLDEQGKEIAITNAQTKSDWMTSEFVPFEATLEFNRPDSDKGVLILEKDNPSGLLENSARIEIPVVFEKSEKIKIKTFFNNSKMDPEFSCNKVFAVEREIPKTQAVARAALEELLKGTRKIEEKDGYFSSLNQDVKIQGLVIENSVAKVDFDSQLEFQVGGSCRVSAIRAQITQTLKQFPTVKDVIISINGRTEDILQP